MQFLIRFFVICHVLFHVVRKFVIERNVVDRPQQVQLEFGMYPQSMPTEWTHARALRPWQSVRLDL